MGKSHQEAVWECWCVAHELRTSQTIRFDLTSISSAQFTDHSFIYRPESVEDQGYSRNGDEFWPIGIVSCLFYLCLNRWRLKWADRSYYGVSCRIPRESWEKGWFIRKVHYPLFPTVLSRLSVIDDCVCLKRLWAIFTNGKFTFPRLRRPECPAGPVLVIYV